MEYQHHSFFVDQLAQSCHRGNTNFTKG